MDMDRCEMCEAPTPVRYETVYRHPDAASERGFFWHTSLTCGACGDECVPESDPYYRGHDVRELLVGHAIETFPEHWDTGDPSDDTGRVPPSRSLWTEPLRSADLHADLADLARHVRYWLTHEPQSYCPADPASLDGERRPEPLTPAELCDLLGIVEPEQVAVLENLATSLWWQSRTGTDWWRG